VTTTPPPPTGNSFVFFDKTYTHTGLKRLYSDWDFVPRMAVQPGLPHNWVTPINYSAGQYLLRVEVIEMQPVSLPVSISFGWWNYYPDPESHHLASKPLPFSKPGVYEQIGNIKDIKCYYKDLTVMQDKQCFTWNWTNAFAEYYSPVWPEGDFYTVIMPGNNPTGKEGFPIKVRTTLTIFAGSVR